jgi:hypothetical protein
VPLAEIPADASSLRSVMEMIPGSQKDIMPDFQHKLKVDDSSASGV